MIDREQTFRQARDILTTFRSKIPSANPRYEESQPLTHMNEEGDIFVYRMRGKLTGEDVTRIDFAEFEIPFGEKHFVINSSGDLKLNGKKVKGTEKNRFTALIADIHQHPLTYWMGESVPHDERTQSSQV